MRRKGFTLIELLAVIIILAIIALIAVPIVMNIINKANKSAFQDSIYGIIKAGELYYADHSLELDGVEDEIVFEFPNNTGNLQVKGSLPSGGKMIINGNGDITLALNNGKYCAKKDYDNMDIIIEKNSKRCVIPGTLIIYKDPILKGTDPKLNDGMIPIVISNDGTVKKADIYSKWYDYSNKEWANVITVTDSSRENTLMQKMEQL